VAPSLYVSASKGLAPRSGGHVGIKVEPGVTWQPSQRRESWRRRSWRRVWRHKSWCRAGLTGGSFSFLSSFLSFFSLPFFSHRTPPAAASGPRAPVWVALRWPAGPPPRPPWPGPTSAPPSWPRCAGRLPHHPRRRRPAIRGRRGHRALPVPRRWGRRCCLPVLHSAARVCRSPPPHPRALHRARPPPALHRVMHCHRWTGKFRVYAM